MHQEGWLEVRNPLSWGPLEECQTPRWTGQAPRPSRTLGGRGRHCRRQQEIRALLGSRGTVPPTPAPPPRPAPRVAPSSPARKWDRKSGRDPLGCAVGSSNSGPRHAAWAFTSPQGSWSGGGLFLFCPFSLGLSVTEQRPLVGPAPASRSPDQNHPRGLFTPDLRDRGPAVTLAAEGCGQAPPAPGATWRQREGPRTSGQGLGTASATAAGVSLVSLFFRDANGLEQAAELAPC